MHPFRSFYRHPNQLFSLKQGITVAVAAFGALVISLAQIPSAHALSFAPGTEFLPYKNQRACIRNGGNFLRWQGETYCTRIKKRHRPRVKVNSYKSCTRAGGQIIKARPRICLWKGRYYTQRVAKPRPTPKPITIRNYRDCVNYGGRITGSNPRRCKIIGRTFYKPGHYNPGRYKPYNRGFEDPFQSSGDEN